MSSERSLLQTNQSQLSQAHMSDAYNTSVITTIYSMGYSSKISKKHIHFNQNFSGSSVDDVYSPNDFVMFGCAILSAKYI